MMKASDVMGQNVFNEDEDPLTGVINKPKPKISAEEVMGRRLTAPGAGMIDPMTFDNRNGGTITAERSFIEDPANADFRAAAVTGRPDAGRNPDTTHAALQPFDAEPQRAAAREARSTIRVNDTPKSSVASPVSKARGGYSATDRPDGMSLSQWHRLGMYERAALRDSYRDSGGKERGSLADARAREAMGTLTLDDALALGIRSSRYGDYGEVREKVGDSRMIRGPYGRGANESSTRMRTRKRTPDEWLEEVFNAPRRAQTKAADEAMNRRTEAAVKAGTLVPGVDEKGNITGYERVKEPEPWKPTAIDTDADGVNDGVMTSRNSYQPYPTKKAEEQPLYAWKEGMPPRILIDENTVGVVNQDKRRYDLHPIKRQKIWGVDPETKKHGERMESNYDTDGLGFYDEWKPEGAAAPEVELSAKDQGALDWAQANPKDPRAVRILERLGVQ